MIEKLENYEVEIPQQKQNKPKKAKKKKSTLKRFISFIIKLSIIITAIWIVMTFIFGVFRLEGNNMYPALKDGDLCITYKLDNYDKNDIVVYKVGDDLLLGRIIGIEGDIIDGNSEGLLINGSQISEEIFYTTNMIDSNLELPITLNENEFFILNDYRENMNDSRYHGIITKKDLNGKVICFLRSKDF